MMNEITITNMKNEVAEFMGSGQSHADDAQHLRVKRERGIGMYVISKVYSKKI